MKIFTYALALAFYLSATPAFAQWAAPTSTPPAGNIATPVNIGTTAQVKNGGLSVNAFSAFSNAYFAGNVGVGTTSPTQKFQVKGGSAQFIGAADNWSGILLGSTASNRPVASFRVSDNSERGKIEINDVNAATGDRLGLFAYSAGLNEVMSIRGNGTVGIGTTSPTARLSVKGSGTGTGLLAQLTDSANASRVTVLDNGNVGLGNINPSARLVLGPSLSQTGNAITLSNGAATAAYAYIGPDATHNLAVGWDPGGAGLITTYSHNNPLYLEGSQVYINALSGGGNVGIGITNPSAKFEVGDANGGRFSVIPSDGGVDIASGNDIQSYLDFKGSGNLVSDYRGRIAYNDGAGFAISSGGLGTASFFMTEGATPNFGMGISTPGYRLEVNGSLGAASFFYTSDESLKKNIVPLKGSLEKISKLKGVSFDWKKDGTPSVGLVAQNVEEVYPELVHESNGVKSVQYGNLVAPLIEAIKEQQKQIDDLKAEVRALKENR